MHSQLPYKSHTKRSGLRQITVKAAPVIAKSLTTTLNPLITPLLFLTMAALIIIGSPGCRFGNHKEETTPPSNPDTVSGYYDLTAQNVKFCMKKEGQANETCVSPSLTKIPPALLGILTDPIALLLINQDNGDGALKNPDGSGYIFTHIAKSGGTYGPSLSYSPTYPSQPLWETNDTCTLDLKRAESGKFTKYDSTHTGANGRTIMGRVNYNVQREWDFSGACVNSLTVMAACFLSSQYCGGVDAQEDNALQNVVQGFFGPFVDAGAFSATDIPDLRMMRYEVNY